MQNSSTSQRNFLKSAVQVAILIFSLIYYSACTPNEKINVDKPEVFAKNIVGGINADAEFQKKNGLVALVIVSEDGQGICTGTLISKRLVLTAAHCLDESTVAIQNIFVVFAPDISAATQNQVRLAVTGKAHELFIVSAMSGAPSWSDIALVKLNEDAPADFQLAQLPPENLEASLPDKSLLVQAGFGKTEATRQVTTDTSGVLRKVDGIELLSKSSDKKELLLKEDGKGSCNGDSGGPAFLTTATGELVQVGLNSRGTTPANCLEVGIFTNVAAHLDWIKTNSELLMADR